MPLSDGKFSPNFDLAQFEFSRTAIEKGLDNRAPDAVRQNLYDLAWVMETVRAFLGGHAIVVTSGYRSPELNKAVGGTGTSHTTGEACDFVVPGFGPPIEVCRALESVLDAVGVGQLIYESLPGRDGRPRQWVHLSIGKVPPVSRVITIDSRGVRQGIHEARDG